MFEKVVQNLDMTAFVPLHLLFSECVTLKRGKSGMDEIQKNEVLHQVQQLLINQTEKGLKKYGTTVNPGELVPTEWIDHASEEIIDMLVYLQVLKVRLKQYER